MQFYLFSIFSRRVGAVLSFLVFLAPSSYALGSEVPDADWLNRMVEACSICHVEGREEHVSEIPHIEGQDRTYLIKQLRSFREKSSAGVETFRLSSRNSHIMDYTSSRLKDEDIKALASYFSRLRCKKKKAIYKIKPDIVCARCHGENGIGVKDGVPNIAGQSKAYMVTQLQMFKKATLNANKNWIQGAVKDEDMLMQRYHRTMGRWTTRFNDEGITTAAEYYSGLPCGH